MDLAGNSESAAARALRRHVRRLLRCTRCPHMHKPVVSGGPVFSRVLLIGQAPGGKEPKLGRPFAWTAGKTLFRWFEEACGMTEAQFRSSIYMAAVCRCFPGKKPGDGDRLPSEEEIRNCSHWLRREVEILRPRLVIPVGKLAIRQLLPMNQRAVGRGSRRATVLGLRLRRSVALPGSPPPCLAPTSKRLSMNSLEELVGRTFQAELAGHRFDLIPLPHPSGASPWHRIEPGRTLLKRALALIVSHPAFPS